MNANDYQSINFGKLLNGQIDGIFDLNSVSNHYEARKKNIASEIKFLELPVGATPIYSVFAKTRAGEMLLREYNDVLSKLPDRLIDDLLKKY